MDQLVMKNTIRIIGLALLLPATLIKPTSLDFMIRPEIQIVLAAVVVFSVLFVDHIFGFILGVSALVLYARVFIHKYGRSSNGFGYPMASLFNGKNTSYITPENLKDAQNNVVDPTDINVPYVGAKGIYGEAVYSAQGLDTNLPGLEKTVGEDFTKPHVM